MPLKLIPPQAARTPNYTIRGTYLKQRVYRSAGTGDRKVAQRMLKAIERDIESGRFIQETGPTFAGAAIRYMNAGGERTFIAPLLNHFQGALLADIDQAAVERAAAALAPNGSPATKNRKVFTPISAILRHSNVHIVLKRPAGAQGKARQHWLREDDAQAFLTAAWRLHPRFAALVTTLLYTGLRLSEALKMKIDDLHLSDGFVDVPATKNGQPQRAHLPPIAVHAIRLALIEPGNATWKRPGAPRTSGSVFCLTKSGALYKLFRDVEAESGVALPPGIAFHLARHTFGAWTRAAGGRLEETGRWTSRAGARPYDHYEMTDAAKVANRFPGANETPRAVRELKSENGAQSVRSGKEIC